MANDVVDDFVMIQGPHQNGGCNRTSWMMSRIRLSITGLASPKASCLKQFMHLPRSNLSLFIRRVEEFG